ncbi:hypothetical protein HYC85_015965 [Camellia sinensis]|uniref:Uncharacterized protein n=1 Tax=Camellia sinensis TaxID=4442 RepID=A0A7J7GZF0_CAMSI|nr:hypothetical protein HYC85_015965 [Camellia sinensis]
MNRARNNKQEKLDSKEWSKTQQEDKLLFYANHKKKTRAKLDYYKLHGSYDHLDQNDRGLRRRISKAVTVATAVAVVTTLVGTEEEGEEVGGCGGGGGGGGGGGTATHRTLWVKNRSQAWWDECNSAEFPEEEFKKGFKMGKETFEMICNELSSAVDKENTSLRDIVPSKTQQEDKLLFYANHKKKTRAKLDYYKLHGSYDHLDQNDRGLRRRKSKAVAVATAVAVVTTLVGTEEEGEEVGGCGGGGGGTATHRRLWVKNRS